MSLVRTDVSTQMSWTPTLAKRQSCFDICHRTASSSFAFLVNNTTKIECRTLNTRFFWVLNRLPRLVVPRSCSTSQRCRWYVHWGNRTEIPLCRTRDVFIPQDTPAYTLFRSEKNEMKMRVMILHTKIHSIATESTTTHAFTNNTIIHPRCQRLRFVNAYGLS